MAPLPKVRGPAAQTAWSRCSNCLLRPPVPKVREAGLQSPWGRTPSCAVSNPKVLGTEPAALGSFMASCRPDPRPAAPDRRIRRPAAWLATTPGAWWLTSTSSKRTTAAADGTSSTWSAPAGPRRWPAAGTAGGGSLLRAHSAPRWVSFTRSDCPQVGQFFALSSTSILKAVLSRPGRHLAEYSNLL